MLEVPKDGHAGCGIEELGNHLIHIFAPNINATEGQQQLHLGKITLEVLHAQHFYCLMVVQ